MITIIAQITSTVTTHAPEEILFKIMEVFSHATKLFQTLIIKYQEFSQEFSHSSAKMHLSVWTPSQRIVDESPITFERKKSAAQRTGRHPHQGGLRPNRLRPR